MVDSQAVERLSPRHHPPAAPGSKFPISGVGAIDNGTVWFRGLFSTLGCALAAGGPLGKDIAPFRVNFDDPIDLGTAPDLRPLIPGRVSV